MFTELSQIMTAMKFKGVGLMVAKEGDMLKVTVSPLSKDGGVIQNFSATDTPENLEKDLPDLLSQYGSVIAAGNNLDDLRKSTDPKTVEEKPKKEKKVKEKVKEEIPPASNEEDTEEDLPSAPTSAPEADTLQLF